MTGIAGTDEVDLDLVFKALGDATRRQLVQSLSRRPATVSELARPLDMSLPAVMQHLRVLEGSGLVRTEKRGRTRTCHLQAAPLRRAEAWIAWRREGWERRLDGLARYLGEDDGPEEGP